VSEEESDDIIRFPFGPFAPRSVAFVQRGVRYPKIVEIDGRKVEFDEEEQEYVFINEDRGDQQIQESVEKVFDEETLFQDQRFFYNGGRGARGTYHVLKEIEGPGSDVPKYVGLCGNSTTFGSPESLSEMAEGISHGHDHPELFTGRVCGSCKRIFEQKTGRTPREDLKKYGRGEDGAE